MNLTIFSCSTGFHCYDNNKQDVYGKSYIERLQVEFPSIQGRWMDGMIIIDVKHELLLKGNQRKVILHIGAVEAFSHPSENILEWGINWIISHGGLDSFFNSMILPMMLKAAHALTHKQKEYYSILTPRDFSVILDLVLILLQGSKVIVVGMSKPNTDKAYWVEQASAFDSILRMETNKHNQTFINVWDICSHCVVDNNHLNEEGHRILFEKIKEILNG